MIETVFLKVVVGKCSNCGEHDEGLLVEVKTPITQAISTMFKVFVCEKCLSRMFRQFTKEE